MELKYGINIDNATIKNELKRVANQTYKLLPRREEGKDWKKPLVTLMIEISGMNRLFIGQSEELFFRLLCKMEGMFTLIEEEDFEKFRGAIFECLGILGELSKCES